MALRLQLSRSAMSSHRHLLLLAFVGILAVPAFGAARLTYYNSGVLIPVAWPETSFPIRYAVDRRVIQAIPQAEAILDRAGKEWSSIPDTSLGFQSLGTVDGAHAGKDGHNTISMADDLFADQNFIALTTNWY